MWARRPSPLLLPPHWAVWPQPLGLWKVQGSGLPFLQDTARTREVISLQILSLCRPVVSKLRFRWKAMDEARFPGTSKCITAREKVGQMLTGVIVDGEGPKSGSDSRTFSCLLTMTAHPPPCSRRPWSTDRGQAMERSGPCA